MMIDLASDQPLIMGIVNVTPDSFSDGGKYLNSACAIEHGLRLLEEGADILDIGGESTRPGSAPVSVEEEIARVIPVIKELSKHGFVSIDTRNAETMRAAAAAGAGMINDITGLAGDNLNAAVEAQLPVCMMHMQGEPQTMQDDPQYGDVVEEVFKFLQDRINECVSAGLNRNDIIADIGIGFGKTLDHNLTLLKNINRFHDLGVPLMLGTSRKGFIARIDAGADADHRLGGSLASVIWGLEHGVKIFRVHDVKQTRQAIKVWRAIKGL